jgi:ParB-like chromosome segregation protein Spo0J
MKDSVNDFLLATIQPNLRLMHNLDVLEELCRFIQAHGQIEPLKLWFDNGSFRIVDGEKQWRACCKLGMTTVQAAIVEIATNG